MKSLCDTTVVTAGDQAYSWGVFLLVASMRRNGMPQPVVVGAMDWTDKMRSLVTSLGDVTIVDVPRSRQCMACQKPAMMASDAVKTDWVCWADGDGAFVGDCSEWLTGDSPDEIVVRKYDPPPPDFTPENLEIWRRDVALHTGRALEKSRYATRVNAPFIVIHRKQFPFLRRWQEQIGNVLPPDVEIIMKHGTAYFQTDESVLGSLLCFDPAAPKVADHYRANGSVDRNRYFAHFAYNPKPWRMWNSFSGKYHDAVMQVVDWLLEQKIVAPSDLPLSLRRRWWWLCRACAWTAPWVWRATKLKRRLFRR